MTNGSGMKNNVAYFPVDNPLTKGFYTRAEPLKGPLQIYSREIDKNIQQVLSLAKAQLLSLTVHQDLSLKKNPDQLVGTVVRNLEDWGKSTHLKI